MLGFNRDANVKTNLLTQVLAHQSANRLAQGGRDGTGGTGGLVWSIVGVVDPTLCAQTLGLPVEIVRAAEATFEGLPPGQAVAWPAQFIGGIVVGGDYTTAWQALAQQIAGGLPTAADHSGAGAAVADLYGRFVSGVGGIPLQTEWDALKALAAPDLGAQIQKRVFGAQVTTLLCVPNAATALLARAGDVARVVASAGQANGSPTAFFVGLSSQLTTLLQAAPTPLG